MERYSRSNPRRRGAPNRIALGFAGLAAFCLALHIQSVAASSFRFVHEFNGKDGRYPKGGLIETGARLYGTTDNGGANGLGTIFSMNPTTGKEVVLHSFAGRRGHDGSYPAAGLVNVGGTLYGTTSAGGRSDIGVVFSLDPATGAERIVHSFVSNGADGAFPESSLISVNGLLYGTTAGGGLRDEGTVFQVNPATGHEKVLHSFFKSSADGREPESGLLYAGGELYGTTFGGGNANGVSDCGTVFKIDSAGAERVVHAFGGTDGCAPDAPLIKADKTLYGTTFYGGALGGGTAYALGPDTGAETVIYSFPDQPPGAINPDGPVIPFGGKLYGVTVYGEKGSAMRAARIPANRSGYGIVYAVGRTTGHESNLHGFEEATGAFPGGGLLDVGGEFFGTTEEGGISGQACPTGCGTVFAFTP